MVTILVAVIRESFWELFGALRHNGMIDYMAMTFAVVGISVPNFVLATLVIQQFAVTWPLLPPATWGSPLHMILPTLALATGPMAIIARCDAGQYAGSVDARLYQNGAG